jgi:hypothetical protein
VDNGVDPALEQVGGSLDNLAVVVCVRDNPQFHVHGRTRQRIKIWHSSRLIPRPGVDPDGSCHLQGILLVEEVLELR